MEIVRTVAALRALTRAWRRNEERIAFVPTMGNLHAGHLALVRRAKAAADRVVVSIFVNPMQFGPGEDYDEYPRTMEADQNALLEEDTELLFVPGLQVIYPRELAQTTRVEVPGLGGILCGKRRPGHFKGVTTVVARLLNLVQPDIAIFGEKDYQQLIIIRRMVEDLCLPVVIEGLPTVREPDGLAMSSRNAYLESTERATAPRLHQVLLEVKAQLEGGEAEYAAVEQTAINRLAAAGFAPEYVSIRRAADLQLPGPRDRIVRVLAAARLGRARLIDNIEITIRNNDNLEKE